MIDLAQLFEQLEDIRDTSSRTEKEQILEEIANSDNKEVMKQLVSFVYNPFRKLNVKVTSAMLELSEQEAIEIRDERPEVTDADTWKDFLAIIERLESGSITGNSARALVCSFIASLDLGLGEWFAMILNKSLKVGIGAATINKLFPNAIPAFGVQLCGKYKGEPLEYPFMVQPKLDGVRGVCGAFTSKRAAFSRAGKMFFNTEQILEQLDILESFFETACVFDGEFYAGTWNQTISILRSEDPQDTSELKFYVFDAIPLYIFLAGEYHETQLMTRDSELRDAVAALANPMIVYVPNQLAQTEQEIDAITTEYVKQGWEGSVIKDPLSGYGYKRSDSWLKYKYVQETDAEIVDVELGYLDALTGSILTDKDPRAANMGGEWAPVVRSLVVDPGTGILTNVGSGLDRADRYKFYEYHAKDELVGQTVEVHYQSVTPDGCLLFPRFVRLRNGE